MVPFSITFTDPKPGFQGHGIFEVKRKSYYRTLIGKHKQSIEWYYFQ